MFIPRVVLAFCMVVFGAGAVWGQSYPSKVIRIVCTGGAGSESKARFIAQGITSPLGQPVIVDPRATSIVTAETGAKAAPDGYTLILTSAVLWTLPLVQKVNYDPVADFSPITLVEGSPSVLVVNSSLPVKSVKELISFAKARPNQLNYGSALQGSQGWFAGELFKSMTGVRMVNVPYKTGQLSITAVATGEVHLSFASTGPIGPFTQSGRVRALAVTSAGPSALVPGLPTMAAAGLPGYEILGFTGMWAPAKTPGAIVNQLNREILRVLSTTEAKERYLNEGSEVLTNSPEQFAALIKSDMAKMGKLIKDAGLKTDI